MSANNYSATNGQLIIQDGLLESQIIGDDQWTNYKIRFNGISIRSGTSFRVLIRVQDEDNYMLFDCHQSGRCGPYSDRTNCIWQRVINGQAQSVVGTDLNCLGGSNNLHLEQLELEVEGNVYRTYMNGTRKLYFIDDTFYSGGLSLQCKGSMTLDSVEVLTVP